MDRLDEGMDGWLKEKKGQGGPGFIQLEGKGGWGRGKRSAIKVTGHQWKSGFSGKVHPARLMMTLAA